MQRAGQQRHHFSKDVVGRDELPPLLSGAAVDSRGSCMIRLRGINQMSPAGGIRKNISHLSDLQRVCSASSPLRTVQGTGHGDLPNQSLGY